MNSKIFLLILLSYLIGSVPSAYILGKILRGIDIRKFGSGNVGATNAFRVLGIAPGVFVLIFDLSKGFFCVTYLVNFLNLTTSLARVLAGLCCVSGHNWTVFLGFKGGKGIATTLGVLVGLAIKIENLGLVVGLVILTWLIVFFLTRIVSLASILSGITLPVYMILFKQSNILVLLSVILSGFILVRHRLNIKRLLCGKEHPLKRLI